MTAEETLAALPQEPKAAIDAFVEWFKAEKPEMPHGDDQFPIARAMSGVVGAVALTVHGRDAAFPEILAAAFRMVYAMGLKRGKWEAWDAEVKP